MLDLATLTELADRYISATGLKEVTLSHRVFGDSKKLSALREGADITVKRFNGALQWFSEHWPAERSWPSHVQRPPVPAAAPPPASVGQAGSRTPPREPATVEGR